jgi:tRNA(Ile)-lysidine synthase
MNPTTERSSCESRLLAAVRVVIDQCRAESGRLVVAYSGGLDSSVLLHALSRLDSSIGIEAFHVDHGWHADSERWSAHCRETAASLGFSCTVERVLATSQFGRSAEEVAREARYGALANFLVKGDTLLTAHHGDDQLETLLMRLFRGTGVRGMRAIHTQASFASGRLVRPLLEFSRVELLALAKAWGIAWLDDPANADSRYDRSYLRSNVLPAIKSRWASAHRVADRVARHMSEAESLLDELAAQDAAEIDDPTCVPLAVLEPLSGARQSNLLRYVLRQCGLPGATDRQLLGLRRCLASASDAETCVCWPGVEARIYRRTLYLMTPIAAMPPDYSGELSQDVPLDGPFGRIELVQVADQGIPDRLTGEPLRVAFRRGGERFLPAGHGQHKSLKHWFQEQAILPWMRQRLPLVYCRDRLIAIADLALAEFSTDTDREGRFWRPVWTQHRRIR